MGRVGSGLGTPRGMVRPFKKDCGGIPAAGLPKVWACMDSSGSGIMCIESEAADRRLGFFRSSQFAMSKSASTSVQSAGSASVSTQKETRPLTISAGASTPRGAVLAEGPLVNSIRTSSNGQKACFPGLRPHRQSILTTNRRRTSRNMVGSLFIESGQSLRSCAAICSASGSDAFRRAGFSALVSSALSALRLP